MTASLRTVRCIDCRAPVELSAFAWEVARSVSELLIARGERPLENDEMSRCEDCAFAWRMRLNA